MKLMYKFSLLIFNELIYGLNFAPGYVHIQYKN